MTEREEQIALIQRANYHPITRDYLFSSVNGGKRHIWEGRSLQLQGMKAGIPDIQLAYPSSGYHGLFIELKRRFPKKGVLSVDQIKWIERLSKVGYCVKVAYGWEEAWKIITNYLLISPNSKNA